MIKDSDAYKTIGEVAKILTFHSRNGNPIKPHTIRFWEKQFSQIRPKILNGNRRYYDTVSYTHLTLPTIYSV